MALLSRPLAVMALTLAAGCTSVPERGPVIEIAEPAPHIGAIAFDRQGVQLYYAVCDGAKNEVKTTVVVSGPVSAADSPIHQPLLFCPERIDILGDGSALMAGDEGSLWLDEKRNVVHSGESVVAAATQRNYVARRGEDHVWISNERQLRLPQTVRDVRILESGSSLIAVSTTSRGEQLIRIDGDQSPLSLTPEFRRLDSFDIAPDEKEIVFSAAPERGFDVGLVSIDGGTINWISPDPADERRVSWAPRGNKVTYFVETAGGLLVRTVHIPTSFQLPIDLPLTVASALAWEPKAERFAMIVSSVDASSRIDLMKYGGESRSTIVPPRRRLETDIVTPVGGDGIAIAPKTLRYNKRYPVAVWLNAERPFEWNDARASLRDLDVGIMVTPREHGELDEAFWRDLESQSWIDPQHVFVVTPIGATMTVTLGTLAEQREGSTRMNDILVSEEGVSTLESFAARWIAARVKGQSDSNGRN